MRKKFLTIILVAIVILIGTMAGYAVLKLNMENAEVDAKYYIHYYDNMIPGSETILKIDDAGKFSIMVNRFSSTLDGNTTTSNNRASLDSSEFRKVKRVLDYLEEKYTFDSKDGFLFYYDYENYEGSFSYDDDQVLSSLVSAIDSIAHGDEMIDGITRREFADNRLDTIIKDMGRVPRPEYTEIKFTTFPVASKTAVKFDDQEEVSVDIKDNKLYINEEITTLESDFNEVYIVDIDNDGKKEVISRTVDDSIAEKNTYIIYRYLEGSLKEALRITILGEIDTFYMKDETLHVEYIPLGAALNEITEEDFILN